MRDDVKTLIGFITLALRDDGQKRALTKIAEAASADQLPPPAFIVRGIGDCVCCGLINQIDKSDWCIDCERGIWPKPALDAKTAKALEDACRRAAADTAERNEANG